MIIRSIQIVLFGLLACQPLCAVAFGVTGHRVVGQIAESYLTEEARRGVDDLLEGRSLAEVSTWSDEIRSDDAWDHASTWHWVTIEDGETYDSSNKNPGGDAIVKLREFIATLHDRKASREQRAVALKWATHLIGDVHQPLHVGRGPDRGGNGVKAEWFGRETNMHRIWDSEIIDSTRLSFSELTRFIDRPARGQVDKWQDSDLMDWIRESMAYRKQVYTVPQSSYEYSFENLPLVKQRLFQAGVRLAGVLNSAFAEH